MPLTEKERFFALVAAPSTLMENLKTFPVMALPLVITIVLFLAALPLSMRMTEMRHDELSRLSYERYGVDNFADEEGRRESLTVTDAVIQSLTRPILNNFGLALWTLLLTKIARGKATIHQYFSMFIHLTVVTTLLSIVSTAVSVVSGNTTDVLSLAIITGGDGTMASYHFYTMISVATLWRGVMTFFGVRELNGFSNRKAGWVTALAVLGPVVLHTVNNASMFVILDYVSL